MAEDNFNFNPDEDDQPGVMERIKKATEQQAVHEIHIYYRVRVNWYELALAVVLVIIFLKEYGIIK